jgi:hypothetical protein
MNPPTLASPLPLPLPLPEIAAAERTPLVQGLLDIINLQQEQLRCQAERIAQLEDELRRLKGGSGRPRLQPSRLESAPAVEPGAGGSAPEARGARRGKVKRRKSVELTIHRRERIAPASLPPGARYKGCRPYVVQELALAVITTCYELEQWQLPGGEYRIGELPPALQGRHYGPQLASFALYQYHHNHVTQPLLLEQLRELGVVISAGQLNRLLTEGQEAFHQEKAALKAVGLSAAAYVQADDTGARHAGRNGYCTVIGNELFAWFETTLSKSRINFLELLQTERCYRVDAEALAYMECHQLAAGHRRVLQTRGEVVFTDPQSWHRYLHQCGVLGTRAQVIATEGALISGLLAQGLPADLGIVSDDAGQFNVFAHALCWVHAERPIAQLQPLTELDRRAVAWVRAQIWELYRELKTYKSAPHAEHKATLETGFDALCATETTYAPLNQALRQLQRNKAELLLVLERPELPLHNNLCERDLRDYVKKRKISAGTRSELGRRCRDTFASLKKTCRKHGISFWAYLKDRVTGTGDIPSLAEVIRQAAQKPS